MVAGIEPVPRVALDVRLVGRRSTGDSTYWFGLLSGLVQLDDKIEYLLLSNAERPPGIPEAHNLRWVHIPSRYDRLWSLVSFPLAARKRGAGAIHTQYNLSPLVGRRGLTTVHDVSFFVEPSWYGPKDGFLLRKGVASSVRRAARVIAVSETSRREIERFLPAARGKTVVTYEARHPAIGPMPPQEARQAIEALGIAPPFILSVGARWPRKNLKLALDAAALLPKELPHRLVLTGPAGDGALHGPRIIEAGYVSETELSALYALADAYLLTSLHEGFGLPILEAFACGCPVICSQGGAIPEVAGDAALVVPGYDPREWAGAIAGLLADRSKMDELRERGFARERLFSWTRTAELTAGAYKHVIGTRS